MKYNLNHFNLYIYSILSHNFKQQIGNYFSEFQQVSSLEIGWSIVPYLVSISRTDTGVPFKAIPLIISLIFALK